MRTLYIHVGPPKTGTSAVQHFVAANPELGIVYPKVGLWSDNAHHKLVFSFFQTKIAGVTLRPIGEYFSEIRDEIDRCAGDILISSELIGDHKDGNQFAESLAHALKDSFSEVRVVIVCREHLERAASLYNQRVKDFAHRETESPDIFLLRSFHNLTYKPTIERFRALDREPIVLNYHSANDLVPTFLAAIGCHVSDDYEQLRLNVSLSVDRLIALMIINRLVSDPQIRKRYFDRICETWEKSKFIFDPNKIAEAKRAFHEDRGYLDREFEIRLPSNPMWAAESNFYITESEMTKLTTLISGVGPYDVEVIQRLKEFLSPA